MFVRLLCSKLLQKTLTLVEFDKKLTKHNLGAIMYCCESKMIKSQKPIIVSKSQYHNILEFYSINDAQPT